MRSKNLGNKPRPLWQEPMDEAAIRQQIDQFSEENIRYGQAKILGFPGTNPDPLAAKIYGEHIFDHSNNIGMHTNKNESESEAGFGGTQMAEREVIAMAADLMDARPEDVDGYITSGGTEANIVGCWIGRNRNCEQKKIREQKTAIVCSYLTHYSIPKAANILGIGEVPCDDGCGLHVLGTDKNGHLLPDQLQAKLDELATKGVSKIIVIGNAGTTMLGSVDDIPTMSEIIGKAKANHREIKLHFHVDAAFGGFVIPFLSYLPRVGFSNINVDSITIDVHKMGLAPYGSGIILARRGLFEKIKSVAPYIPGNDSTLCGSRSGAMALSCWAAMKKIGKDGYSFHANRLTSMAHTIQLKMKGAGFETFLNDINIVAVKGNLPRELRSTYITHVHEGFPANLDRPFESAKTTVWNIVVMHHTKMELIDELITKLKP